MTTFKQFCVSETDKTIWTCNVVTHKGGGEPTARCRKRKQSLDGGESKKEKPLLKGQTTLPVVTTKGVRNVNSKKKEVPIGLAIQDDPKYTKYFKMLKVGLSPPAVKNKMTKDGVDPSILDMDPTKPPEIKKDDGPVYADGLAIQDDPKYTKYFKMLKVGLSPPAVKNKMTKDGVDPSILDMDPTKPPEIKKDDGPVYADGLAIQDDPKYTKYFKMLKVGLSPPAVKNKMTKDGVDPSILDMDPTKPPEITKKVTTSTNTSKLDRQLELKGNELDRKGTVYENLSNLECCEFDDIENELKTKKKKKKKKKNKSALQKPKKSNRQPFFEFETSNDIFQIKIIASQYSNSKNFDKLFKEFDVSQLIEDGITSKQLEAKFVILKKLVMQYNKKPEKEKKKKRRKTDHVFSFVSKLSTIEQPEILDFLVFKIYFENEQRALLETVNSVTNAAKNVFDSAELSKLLGIMVNAVNAGREQYVRKNGVQIPLVTGVPPFSVMNKFLMDSNLLSTIIARKMLTSKSDVIKRITNNMEIKDLLWAYSIDIKVLMTDFEKLKTESKKNFKRKLAFKNYVNKSNEKLQYMEKEVVNMNNIIKAVEKKYAIDPGKDGTLRQVMTFILQWNNCVMKARILLKNTAGETKKSELPVKKKSNSSTNEMLLKVQQFRKRVPETDDNWEEEDKN